MVLFVIFSSSCQTLLCFGQTVLFVIFSSSCQTLLCFGQTVLFVVLLFTLVVCQTLLFGQTVLFVILLFTLVVVRLFCVLDRRYCLLFVIYSSSCQTLLCFGQTVLFCCFL